MKTLPHLTLPRVLLPSSAGQGVDVGLLCTVGLSTQDLAVELQILKTLPKDAQRPHAWLLAIIWNFYLCPMSN